MNNLFSIIIPVYNAEKTIKRCLDSLLSQTYTNFEVLLIDDGSTDNSLKLLMEYVDKDDRFKVCSQANGGPSVARNKGLDNTVGNIVCFIDSDDYVSENYLEELNTKFNENNADIVFISYNRFNKSGITSSQSLSNIGENYFENIPILSKVDMYGYTWIKSIKRDIIGDIRFDEQLSLFEDEIFVCDISNQKLKMNYIDKPIYNYYVNNCNSLIGKTYNDYHFKCEKVYEAWKRMFELIPSQNDILINKANSLTKNCEYYGLERDVDYLSFYKELSNCTFFKESNVDDKLINAIRNNDVFTMKYEYYKYKFKNKVATLLKK